MTGKDEQAMRTYWDERARLNAVWYVDTSLSFDAPDLERFFETGRRVVDEAFDGSPVQPPGTSLAIEIGAGLGRICKALADRFERVVGIDVSSEMVGRARELVDDPRITFEVGDGVTLAQHPDASADMILSFTVFQHIPSTSVIEGYIAEAGRVLKPGGLFVFQWNNTPGARRWAVRRTLFDLAQRVGVTERYGRNAREFLGSRVPLSRIRRALDRGGMDLVHTAGLDTLFAWTWAVKRGARA